MSVAAKDGRDNLSFGLSLQLRHYLYPSTLRYCQGELDRQAVMESLGSSDVNPFKHAGLCDFVLLTAQATSTEMVET